jgi:aminocarboxymuconate-semialdehyde decarboxylase
MDIIDTHTHILPNVIPDWNKLFGHTGFVNLEDILDEDTRDKKMTKNDKFFRRIHCNCFDPIERIKDIGANSIKLQVLSTVPVMFNYWALSEECLITSRYINDDIAKTCLQYPDKFIGLGTVPMQNIEMACEELKRCIVTLGLKGVEIGTNINGKMLDDEIFYPFWQCVEDIGAVVFVHPWDMMGSDRLEKHWLSWLVAMPAETSAAISCMIFGGIYKRFPNIKVYYAHGGGSFINNLGRIQKGYDCRPDLYPEQCSPKKYLKYIMVDSLTHDQDVLAQLIKHIGAKNIMCGSDYPFPLGDPDVGKFSNTLSVEQSKMILYENARKFFNINVDKNI